MDKSEGKNMAGIKGVFAREVLDCRGFPTLECTLWLDNGGIVVTSVATGMDPNPHEALELLDGDPNRFKGRGVQKAVNIINTQISPQLVGKDPQHQQEIDQLLVELDGTKRRERLGANTLMVVSQAVLKAGALSVNLPVYFYLHQKYQLVADLKIPTCVYTMISGGPHSGSNLDLNEFQLIPASHLPFSSSLDLATNMFHHLREVLAMKGANTSVGMMGGFTPNFYNNSDVFEILLETAKTTRYVFGQDLFFGIDAEAGSFHNSGKYKLKDRSEAYTTKELTTYYRSLEDLYRIFYFEDPFAMSDEEGWRDFMTQFGDTALITGDQMISTNLERVQYAIANRLCNTVLIKPNQVGTVSETIAVVQQARAAGMSLVVAHRSGETNDDIIADLGVGLGAHYVKFGPPNRGERVAKFNRLLQIEMEIERSKTEGKTPQPLPTSPVSTPTS